jgi:ubiquinone biosynthesis protein
VFYATARVLVTEYIEGVLMSDYVHVLTTDPGGLERWHRENGIVPRKIGRLLLLSLLRQLLENNLFHGDLHPGNILLLKDNRVALIDFGTCSFTERGTLEQFQLSILALSRRDYSQAADVYMLLSGTLPQGVDAQQVRDEFLQTLCKWGDGTTVRELPYHEKSIAAIYNAVLLILFNHHCTMGWALLRIRRALETLDASLIHMFPDCNYSAIAAIYVREAALRRADATAERGPAAGFGAVAATFDVGARLAEYTMFQAGILRRHVRVFRATGNKAMDMLSTAVSQLAVLGVIGTGLSFAIWVAQHHPRWMQLVVGGVATAQLSRWYPPLDWQVWVGLLFVCAYGSAVLVRLSGRLRRHERRAAERVAAV